MTALNPLIEDPEYVQGQIASIHALILALAAAVPLDVFTQAAMERLEVLKTAMLDSTATDVRLLAVDHMVAWIKHLGGSDDQ